MIVTSYRQHQPPAVLKRSPPMRKGKFWSPQNWQPYMCGDMDMKMVLQMLLAMGDDGEWVGMCGGVSHSTYGRQCTVRMSLICIHRRNSSWNWEGTEGQVQKAWWQMGCREGVPSHWRESGKGIRPLHRKKWIFFCLKWHFSEFWAAFFVHVLALHCNASGCLKFWNATNLGDNLH